MQERLGNTPPPIVKVLADFNVTTYARFREEAFLATLRAGAFLARSRAALTSLLIQQAFDKRVSSQ
jgi:hypothetical protein